MTQTGPGMSNEYGYKKHYVAKLKALISCAVTVQLICVFVFAYATSRRSHDGSHIIVI